jgi:DNA polymerase-3 subunit gamma/tau
VQRALVNALDNDRLHHAYLFTGTRGVEVQCLRGNQ